MRKQNKNQTKLEEESYSYLDKILGTIYLVGEINPKVASVFRQQLRTLERLKKHSSIVVEINSPGGDIEPGLMIIDSIELCNKPVITRVTGVAMSMGALILASGSKREALPNSTVMIHQGSYTISVPFDELDNEVAENKRIEKLCNDFLDRTTGKEPGYWEKRCGGKNLYLTAEQCIAENVIQSILNKKS